MPAPIARTLPTQRMPLLVPLPPSVAQTGFPAIPRALFSAEGTSAGDILKDAVFYIDALDHQRAGSHPKTIRNLGISGTPLDARCGSTSIADSNDPKFLDYQGATYVYVTGSSGNSLSTPDASALDIVGDIDIRALVALDDWTPAAKGAIIGKFAGPGYSYVLFINSNGTLSLVWTPDGIGASQITATSTANLSALADGSMKWVRATLDVDNGAAGNTTRFYTSDDGSTWTQLGADVTKAGIAVIFSGAALLTMGISSGTFDGLAMKIYRAQIYNGIAGTLVFDADTSVITSGSATSFTATTGQTVTINRSTSGRKSVAVVAPCWLLGTDDFIEVRDNPAINFSGQDSFTIFVVSRAWSYAAQQAVINKKNLRNTVTDAGYFIQRTTTSGVIRAALSDGTNGVTNYASSKTATTVGSLATISLVKSQGFWSEYEKTAADSPTTNAVQGSLSNQRPLQIGAAYADSFYMDGELVSVAIFRRALSATEISTLNTFFQARNP